MILSVSRRTDIPAFYSGWFFNRIKAGFVYVRNPMNPHQISSVRLSPEVVDCIVFWTKNPENMLSRLDDLAGYAYYFQFTLTPYGQDLELLPGRQKEHLISVFRRLSEKIGRERVIWRYDPIIFTPEYTAPVHLHRFEQMAKALEGCTDKCVISCVDMYAKIRKNVERLGIYAPSRNELLSFARELAGIAGEHHMAMATCAEATDLKSCGISHNCCIDKALIERLTGCTLSVTKDKNQRPQCGCAPSIDIGTYNTCLNGCRYCYANFSQESVLKNHRQYDPDAPLLCGTVREGDQVKEREVKVMREGQMRLRL